MANKNTRRARRALAIAVAEHHRAGQKIVNPPCKRTRNPKAIDTWGMISTVTAAFH
jgi:hypothetical protein